MHQQIYHLFFIGWVFSYKNTFERCVYMLEAVYNGLSWERSYR